MNNYDFVAIGDITTDAFIELEQAHVEEDTKLHKKELVMNFGDKLPYKNVVVVKAVGNAPNAAVSAHRLGLSSALVTHVGADEHGDETKEQLQKQGVAMDFVQTQTGKSTNYHYVLRLKEERTILIKHESYDYQLPDIGQPKWIYFSSVGDDSMEYHKQISEFVGSHDDTKLVFQPGSFQIELGAQKLDFLYKNTELFFCNKEEAQRILKSKEDDVKELLKSVFALGPKIPVITDGPEGAYAYDGEHAWYVPMYPDPKQPVDRTGAGDSFASCFTSYRAKGMEIKDCLLRAPINSMSVVQYIGAQEGLLSNDQVEEYLKNAPKDYDLQQII